jgi:hypothetical protein
MRVTGREIQGLLGAIMIHFHLPFLRTSKTTLSPLELTLIDGIEKRLQVARDGIKPNKPRETPGWLEVLLNAETDILLTKDEAHALHKITTSCLNEIGTDGGLSAFVGPGVRVDSLRSAHTKVATQLAE